MASMLNTFISKGHLGWDSCLVSEFGCGPKRHFQRSLSSLCGDAIRFYSYDLVAWDSDVSSFDLEIDSFKLLPVTQLAVLSGVLEYVDVPFVVERLFAHFEYLCFSYAPLPAECCSDDRLLVDILNRCIARGWKNHLTLASLLAVVDRVAIVESLEACHYYGDQFLFIARSRCLEERLVDPAGQQIGSQP